MSCLLLLQVQTWVWSFVYLMPGLTFTNIHQRSRFHLMLQRLRNVVTWWLMIMHDWVDLERLWSYFKWHKYLFSGIAANWSLLSGQASCHFMQYPNQLLASRGREYTFPQETIPSSLAATAPSETAPLGSQLKHHPDISWFLELHTLNHHYCHWIHD